MTRYCLTLLVLLCFACVSAQVKTSDTLIQELLNYRSGPDGVSLKDTLKVNIYSHIINRDYAHKPLQTMAYIAQMEKLSAEIDYPWGIAKANEMRGNIYDIQRKYPQALQGFKKALVIYNEIGDFRSIDVTNNIGIVYSKQGIYAEALEHHLKGLSLSEKYKDDYGFISSYNNIGILYTNLQNYGKALEYYHKCLKIQQRKGAGYGISNTYQNIGELYRLQKQYDKALAYLASGVKSAIAENDNISLANCYSTTSQIYADRGQYQKALPANAKAFALRQKIDDSYGLFTSYSTFVIIYRKLGDNQKALMYAQKALAHLYGHGELDMHKQAYKQLAEVQAAMGNYTAAYRSHELYKTYSDSVFNAENQRKLVEQQMNFDFRKKELLAQEALQRQKFLRNLIAGAITIIAISLIVFLVRRHRAKTRQRKEEYDKGLLVLQDELDIKEVEAKALKLDNENVHLKNSLMAAENEILQEKIDYNKREMASVMLYASQKNEMLTGLRTEIDTFREGKVTAGQIDKIKSVIHQNQYLDADWEKFRLHFEQVHPDFFTKLDAEHPGLTAYETRLCAYLHIKLSTKEIANLLNITPASVTKAKVRLNKKLNRKGEG